VQNVASAGVQATFSPESLSASNVCSAACFTQTAQISLPVGGQSSGTLSLDLAFEGGAGEIPNWISVQPSEFAYPQNGEAVGVELQVCPQLGSLTDGSYTTSLLLNDGESGFGVLPISFDYSNLCADVFLPDTSTDLGTQCSDVGRQAYWDSPAIAVQRSDTAPPSGEFGTSEFPVLGQTTYVYVQARNRGPEAAPNALVTLYTSDNLFNDTFPEDWQEVGQQTVSVGVGESIWVGPFTWVPTQEFLSLYASISTGEDPVITPNDVACDNNIALLSRIPMVLDNPSYAPGLLAGTLPLFLESSLTYSTLDLQLDLGNLSGSNSYAAVDLDQETFLNWTNGGSLLLGGDILSSGRIISNPGTLTMQIKEIVGGPTVLADLNLLVVASPREQGNLPIALNSLDRTVTGATIYYKTDPYRLPAFQSSLPEESLAEAEEGFTITSLLPILCTVLLLAIWLVTRYFRS
jgi:hypothetical protein